jgi:hypothetical protein
MVIPWQYDVGPHYHDWKKAWVQAYRQTNDAALAGELSRRVIYPDPKRTNLDRKLEWLRRNRYSLFRAGDNYPEISKPIVPSSSD